MKRMILIAVAFAGSVALAAGMGGMVPGGGMQPGGGVQPGGGNQPNQPGGNAGSFVYDSFLTASSVSNGAVVYGNLWTGYDPSATTIKVPSTVTAVVPGVCAGNTVVTTIDLSATTITNLPTAAIRGCTALTTVKMPSDDPTVDPDPEPTPDPEPDPETDDLSIVAPVSGVYTNTASSEKSVYQTDAGRVTCVTRKAGTGTLTATVKSGYVFLGWYEGETCLARTTSLKFTLTGEDIRYTARFVTKAADAAAIACTLDGCDLSDTESLAVSNTCGVCVTYPVEATSLSTVTVAASGLPAGIKLVYNKTTGAYVLAGVPTTASTKSVKITVTSGGKSKRVFLVQWTVGALAKTSVGTWNGVAAAVAEDGTETPYGSFTLTATAAGAVSAKAVTTVGTASFSGKGWTEDADGLLEMTLTNKTYGVLTVQLDPCADWTDDSLAGSLSGTKFGDGVLQVSAYRSPYGKSGKVVENAEAQAVLAAAVGTRSLDVTGPDGATLSGTAKILKTGKVTVSGKLTGGKTSYTMSGVLEVRSDGETLVSAIRLVGITKSGAVWCNEEVTE